MTDASGFRPKTQAMVVGRFIMGFIATFAWTEAASAGPNDPVAPLASANFGWQTNVADWRDPPPG